jgi:tRNA threonylcarbamoyladenosine biosynthesis protein TsaB
LLLLAADTSGKSGSIALADCDADDCMVVETLPLVGGTFSAQLVPQIAALLEKHKFTRRDIGAFAVASGPGSFTGLRVGLAAIKALAEVLQKPIAAVSLLEALAVSSQVPGRIVAALDAGRAEFYVGEYRPTVERVMTREEFLCSAAGSTIVTPDAAVVEASRSRGLIVEQVERPGSAAIARIGWQRIQSGQTVSPEDLEANYLRRSDAEIFSRSNP